MPRDNEKIIEILANLQKSFKEALIPLIEADAPPFAVSRVMESYQALGEIINHLGEDDRMLIHRYNSPPTDLVEVEAIALKVITPVAERLEAIIKRVEERV